MSKHKNARLDKKYSNPLNPFKANILVTGGAGFIGSNFIRHILGMPDFTGMVINYDKLTYAGNLLSLSDIAGQTDQKKYIFERGDICDYETVKNILDEYNIAAI